MGYPKESVRRGRMAEARKSEEPKDLSMHVTPVATRGFVSFMQLATFWLNVGGERWYHADRIRTGSNNIILSTQRTERLLLSPSVVLSSLFDCQKADQQTQILPQFWTRNDRKELRSHVATSPRLSASVIRVNANFFTQAETDSAQQLGIRSSRLPYVHRLRWGRICLPAAPFVKVTEGIDDELQWTPDKVPEH